MAHDLVIRGGLVVDGTGDEPVNVDVAIDDGMISAIGAVEGKGRKEIDATGHIVTPGFVDLHTHMDAQIGWDPMMTPLTWHGVTTVLLGNCGVTFAPCKPEDRRFLAEMMETVEDIPRDAILEGLPWDWEDYGGYLDSLERLKPSVNVAGLVGHCAVRYYVMGDRSITDQPTPEEQSQIAQIVGESIAAGAAGFSTSRFMAHVLPDGRKIPGTFALDEELVSIAEAIKENGGGLMQNILNLPDNAAHEFELLRKQARASGGRVVFSIGCGSDENSGAKVAAAIERISADGLDISGLAIPRSSGFVMGLVNLLPYRSHSWGVLFKQDLAGRMRTLEDPEAFAELAADAREQGIKSAPILFWLGDGETPDYTNRPDYCLKALAEAAGEHPAETFLRMARESGGRALFLLRIFNPNLKAIADLVSSERCFPGLGDAGAHVGQVVDVGWATFVLSHHVRKTGLFTIQEAIRRLTSAPARILGLSDRGKLAVGMRADLNVIDLQRVTELMPEYVHDFPGGAGRYIQRARGYRASVCNGQIVLENDKSTGARAGHVLRKFD